MVKTNTTGLLGGYYSFDSIMSNAYYVAKWNPKLAISWLDEVRYEVTNEMRADRFNKVVDRINTFLDSLEKMRYYDKKEVWGAYAPERAVPMLVY